MPDDDSDNPASDLQGVSRLAVDAVIGVTDLTESVHRTIRTFGGLIADAERDRTGGLTGFVYDNIRSVTGLVGVGLEAGLDELADRLGKRESSTWRDTVVGALNGVIGDYLEATDNPLAVKMHLRRDGQRIEAVDDALRQAVREADGRIVLMVHGSSATEHLWRRDGHEHGEALARDLGVVPVYVRYNSGRHISENGAELAALLERFVGEFDQSVELDILAHSMGGLVARSAIRTGTSESASWTGAVSSLICLGTPHHGAPLERYGNYIDHILELTPYIAPFGRLGRIRSAGITDLRYGNVSREDWEGRDRFRLADDPRQPVALPAGVDCYAIAATTGEEYDETSPGGASDGLVPVDSALGHHKEAAFELEFPDANRWVGTRMTHLDLLGNLEVYEVLRGWLSRSRG